MKSWIRMHWDDSHNVFNRTNESSVPMPSQIEKVLIELASKSGLKRTRTIYIIALAALVFILFCIVAYILYEQGNNVWGTVVLVVCPFLAYYFVAWWSINYDRLGKVQHFLKTHEPKFQVELLEIRYNMSALFVKGKMIMTSR